MRIAFVLFDRMTLLDFIGFYDVITRLKTMGFDEDVTWRCCALKEEIRDDKGLVIKADVVGESLDGYDMVFIPGGVGTRVLQHDEIFIAWIKSAKFAKFKVSVCTGSLLLGAAGFLKEHHATTHPGAYEELKPYCEKVLRDRIVDEDTIITAGGVTSSIDLGLYLCHRLWGEDATLTIASGMDYPYIRI